MIGNARVYRIRKDPGSIDEYGDPVSSTETRVLLEGAGVAPRSSEDITDQGRQGVIVGLSLYLPFGTDFLHTDQAEVDGVVYDVEGEPGSWKSPLTSWEAGMEIALRRAVG